MVDDALIALKESTEFAIVAYQYEQDPVNDQSTIELVQGGFRTITGNIGQQNKEAYEARISNFATIGIRGTDYEAVITPQGEVLTGVYDGGTTISNTAGTLDLGIGADFDFARVVSANSPPEGLLLQPPGLGDVSADLTQETEDSNEDEEQTENSADQNGDTDDSDGGTNQPGNTDNAQNPANTQAADNSVLAAAANNREDSSDDSNLSFESPSPELIASTSPETSTSTTLAETEREETRSALSINPVEDDSPNSISCSTDSLLCLQLNDGQVLGLRSDDVDEPEDDLAPEDSGDNAANGSDSGTGTDTGTGSDSDSDSDSTVVDGDSGDNGNSGTSGSGNGNNGNGNGNSGDNGNSGTSGSGNGNNGNGNGNSGDNGNSGTSGSGSSNSGDSGNSGTSGSGNGNNGNGNGNSGDNGNSGTSGSGNGNSGNSGNNGSGNNSSDEEDETSTVDNEDGSSTSTSSDGDQTTTTTSRNGQTVTVVTDEDGNVTGSTTVSPNGSSAVVTLNADGTTTTTTTKSNGQVTVTTTSSLSLPEPSTDAHNIAWGKWNNSIDNNWVVVQQLDDELVQISTSNYFAEANPTPVANLKGSHNYTTGIASSFIGSGNVGDINSLIAAMDVNFDNGSINNGSLEILSGGQSWSVDFDGLINQGSVNLNMIDGLLIDSSGLISNSIGGDLGGVFSGNKAETFVGGFDLIDEINTLNHVDGLFTIER